MAPKARDQETEAKLDLPAEGRRKITQEKRLSKAQTTQRKLQYETKMNVAVGSTPDLTQTWHSMSGRLVPKALAAAPTNQCSFEILVSAFALPPVNHAVRSTPGVNHVTTRPRASPEGPRTCRKNAWLSSDFISSNAECIQMSHDAPHATQDHRATSRMVDRARPLTHQMPRCLRSCCLHLVLRSALSS